MIQMMQGHALTILSEMPRDCLFDAVITDPPYASGAATLSGISAKTSTKYTSSKRGNCPYPDFCRPQKGRFRQQTENILWGSNGALPVDRPVPCLPGVFTCPNVSGKERRHQTQKPLWRLIWRDTMQ